MKEKIELLITVGEYAQFIGKNSTIKNWKHFQDSVLASNFLKNEVMDNDIVCCKDPTA